MKVCFAPDYREGVPYQQLLADALIGEGIDVEFLRGYRRAFPLSRGLAKQPADLLHLHWPEAYYPPRGDIYDGLRRLRFPLDLALTTRRLPMILTAHNQLPHDREKEMGVRSNVRTVYREAKAVIFHSATAKEKIKTAYRLKDHQCHLVPPGDLAAHYGEPMPMSLARQRLKLASGQVVLIFGAVAPYKGIDEVVKHWARGGLRAKLVVAGRPTSEAYGKELIEMAKGHPLIQFHFQWLSDKDLIAWLSAADCVLFNYRSILNSGGACLARSWGVPILLPRRLDTVELDEPHPLVFRFDNWKTDFAEQLTAALKVQRDYNAATDWRRANAWPEIARATASIYAQCLNEWRVG